MAINIIMLNQIIHGDCFEVLKDIPDNYFDSLISDPPAGISFMNKDFDHNKGGMLNWINWLSEIMAECLRVMKPGACGLVWSLPRTSHWTGMALELAGFKIIDIVHHANGMGFPKGQDISKQLDLLLGEKRSVIGKVRKTPSFDEGWNYGNSNQTYEQTITAPASPEAKQWDGWKTPALKPAIEDWWLVQKPISESSIARNILKHGVGGLNIEACRIGNSKRVPGAISKAGRNVYGRYEIDSGDEDGHNPNIGRYPANLILSCGANCKGENHSPDCPVSVIGGQTGESISRQNQVSDNRRYAKNVIYGSGLPGERHRLNSHSDSGTAARFFKQLPFDPETIPSVYYQAKASPSDRSNSGEIENTHPTVKSRHLMKYLITLITPDNGTVLDPFCGSGTTAVACKELGRNYICIEKEKEYFDIACDRISQPREYSETELEIMELKQPEFKQLSLFDVA
jgi:site-specific DNA-methyltransferase (adenine-specific)